MIETDNSYEGYHTFGGVGSFQVFYMGQAQGEKPAKYDWYWWACFPGCMPDSDEVGPFATSIEAYNDAQESDHG